MNRVDVEMTKNNEVDSFSSPTQEAIDNDTKIRRQRPRNINNGAISSNGYYSALSSDSINSTILPRPPYCCLLGNDKWWMMFYGQLLSFGLSASGATNDVLVHSYNVHTPTFQMALVYLCLGIGYGIKNGRRQGCCTSSSSSSNNNYRLLFRIFLVALCDVEANYFAFLSFQYASFESVTLLMSLSIPSTMISSSILLQRKYTKIHYLGASICFIGSCLTVLNDTTATSPSSTSSNNTTSNPFLGDVLAISGAILYGLVDTLMEWAIKNSANSANNVETNSSNFSPEEAVDLFMCRFGWLGAGTALFQVGLLERSQVFSYLTSTSTMAKVWTSLFVTTTTLCYIGTTRFLLHYEAAMFNLSLLTSNGWAVLFTFFYDKETNTGFFFFFSLVVIIIGVVVYEIAPSPVVLTIPTRMINDDENLSSSSCSTMSEEGVPVQSLLQEEPANNNNTSDFSII